MEAEILKESLELAEHIDQLTAKGVMLFMLLMTCGVCYFLLRRIFHDMDTLKQQIILNKKMEENIEKIAITTNQSLDFLKDSITEQKGHNEFIRKQMEMNVTQINHKIQELETKVYKLVHTTMTDAKSYPLN